MPRKANVPQTNEIIPQLRLMQVERDAVGLVDSTDKVVDQQFYNMNNPDARPDAIKRLMARAPKNVDVVDALDE